MYIEFAICLIIILIICFVFFNQKESFESDNDNDTDMYQCGENYIKNDEMKKCPDECSTEVCDDSNPPNCTCEYNQKILENSTGDNVETYDDFKLVN